MNITSYTQVGHASTGMKHGPDGAILLDNKIEAFIHFYFNEKRVVDLGCGAGDFTIAAARAGAAEVLGIDIQEGMIKEGRKAVERAKLSERQVTLVVGDVTDLRTRSTNYFDCALTLNVGCNLPKLSLHFLEMARVLKETGKALLTSPSSLDVVFTSGERELSEVKQNIDEVLKKVDASDSNSIVENLKTLADVYSATFFVHDGNLKLLTPDISLDNGTKIWRKLPKCVIPNVYHSEEEYLTEAKNAGFIIKGMQKPKFNTKADWFAYNQEHPEAKLGEAYAEHNPFTIIELEKAPATFFNELFVLLRQLVSLVFLKIFLANNAKSS